jgi:transcription elongation factor Elf1
MVYNTIKEREVHKMIKTLFKRLFCKHEYKWYATTTLSNSAGLLDHELIIIYVECEKCGKRKSIEFKKPIDK